jgi:hypothetical protein
MSQFNSNPSRKYLAAVEALKRIPFDERDRAYADATADDWKRLADEQGGPKPKGKTSWRRLLGKPAQVADRLPGDDHIELRQGKELTYISQPYHLNFEQLCEIVSACAANGLKASIDARSWYFPGAAIRVTYCRATSN